jgi:hypothetical protein
MQFSPAFLIGCQFYQGDLHRPEYIDEVDYLFGLILYWGNVKKMIWTRVEVQVKDFERCGSWHLVMVLPSALANG